MTRAWWREVRASAMAATFEAVDWHRLFILAVLVDMFWAEPSKELAGEIRLQGQAFGLSPIDRWRLGWKIAQPEERTGPRRNPAPADPAPVVDDPRAALRMVK
jgi:hypothetical protein